MNRIEQVFGELSRRKEKALIPYVCCGDPDLSLTEELVPELAQHGADLVELGVPYSDPVADGPTVQRASLRALEGRVTLAQIFSLAERIRKKTPIPLIMMTYYNPVFVSGRENFARRAAAAGVDGLIIPDLPVEEAGPVQEALEINGLDLIFLAAPTSTGERVKEIVRRARGFIYCVSVTGVTGARQDLSHQLAPLARRLRAETGLPLAAGFGISGPENARKAAELTDGVIVGSALIERIEGALRENPGNYAGAIKEACFFLRGLKDALEQG